MSGAFVGAIVDAIERSASPWASYPALSDEAVTSRVDIGQQRRTFQGK
jgi:hypothetical protein